MKYLLILLVTCVCHHVILAQEPSKTELKAMENLHNGNIEKAVKLFTKELENDSLSSFSIANRGMCYLKLKQYENGLSDMLKLDRLFPGNARTNFYIGRSYFLLKNYAKGAFHLEKAIELGFEVSSGLNYDVGTCFYFSGDNDKARPYLERACILDPSNSSALNNLAWAYLDTIPEKSCSLFKKAYLTDSTSVPNINNLGYSHLMCGNLEVARTYFERAGKLDPTNSFVPRNMGLYYMYSDQKEKACENLQKAIKLKIVEKYGTSYIEELQNYCSE